MLDVFNSEAVIEEPEVLVWGIFQHYTCCFSFTAPDNLVELHDIWMLQQLSDKDFSFDFGFVYGTKNLDGDRSPNHHVISLEHVGISSPPDLFDDLEVFLLAELSVKLVPPINLDVFVVDLRQLLVQVDIGIIMALDLRPWLHF